MNNNKPPNDNHEADNLIAFVNQLRKMSEQPCPSRTECDSAFCMSDSNGDIIRF